MGTGLGATTAGLGVVLGVGLGVGWRERDQTAVRGAMGAAHRHHAFARTEAEAQPRRGVLGAARGRRVLDLGRVAVVLAAVEALHRVGAGGTRRRAAQQVRRLAVVERTGHVVQLRGRGHRRQRRRVARAAEIGTHLGEKE